MRNKTAARSKTISAILILTAMFAASSGAINLCNGQEAAQNSVEAVAEPAWDADTAASLEDEDDSAAALNGEADSALPDPDEEDAAQTEEFYRNLKPADLWIHPDFEQWYEANEDIVGWLWNGNDLDHPVVQYDNDYYLHHDYYLQDDNDGTLFVNAYCNLWPRDWMIVIHGHHMKSGAMFGRLMNYENYSYVSEYPLIGFRTVTDDSDVFYAPVAAFNASMVETDPSYFLVLEPLVIYDEAAWLLGPDPEIEYPEAVGDEAETENPSDNAQEPSSEEASEETSDDPQIPSSEKVEDPPEEPETESEWQKAEDARLYQVMEDAFADLPYDELSYEEKTEILVDALKEDYLERILARSIWVSPLDVTTEDELLMLSTCSYYQEDGRFMLVLRKLREEETPDSVFVQF